MKKYYILFLLCFAASSFYAQDPLIDSWLFNSTGKTASYWEYNPQSGQYTFHDLTDEADVLKVCFDKDTVWIECEGMTNDMGIYSNPNAITAQSYTFKFPRNPVAGSGDEEAPEINCVGVLTNGVPMYALSDGKSYDNGSNTNTTPGLGVWVGEAYYTEGITLDTAFAAHPQQQGAYHSHATPFRLYADPSSAHSPIVGFANDGFPVYGPFGYTSAMDSTSGISRMVSGYELRNITDRTTLPGGSTSTPPGPAITTNGDFDLGSYIQDYEYIGGAGSTLDKHNGRLCVTPEYPQGTYAYFVTVDANGIPQFPYYVGPTYYGTPIADNNAGTATTPGSGVQCLPLTSSIGENNFLAKELEVYPNPSNGLTTITLPEEATGAFDVRIIDNTGKLVYARNMVDSGEMISIDLSKLSAGIYVARIIGYQQLFTSKFVIE